jgi:hypothetical protein
LPHNLLFLLDYLTHSDNTVDPCTYFHIGDKLLCNTFHWKRVIYSTTTSRLVNFLQTSITWLICNTATQWDCKEATFLLKQLTVLAEKTQLTFYRTEHNVLPDFQIQAKDWYESRQHIHTHMQNSH